MIINAFQRGSVVYVYGRHKRLLGSYNGDLQNHTKNTVSIKRGNVVYVYDFEGNQVDSYNY